MPPGSTGSEWRAEEAVCARFSLEWNAVTSRWGALADIINAFGISAVAGLLLLLAVHWRLTAAAWALGVLAAAPILICVVANIALLGSRAKVVAWLSSLPFPVENLNAILAGFGEEFEVYFEGDAPSRDRIMEHFARVSEDVFVLETHVDQKMVRSRLGVIVSKHNPQRQAQARYSRFRLVADQALVPLHGQHAIARVLVI
ncbi:MAG: hypothetical protein HY898_13555 [Deltaproteobacteria bacterium]|nr:hypothetical protein [Deltaproteobacteria bacterium]